MTGTHGDYTRHDRRTASDADQQILDELGEVKRVVGEMGAALKVQNGRVTANEDWRKEHQKYTNGVAQQLAQLTATTNPEHYRAVIAEELVKSQSSRDDQIADVIRRTIQEDKQKADAASWQTVKSDIQGALRKAGVAAVVLFLSALVTLVMRGGWTP